MRNFAERFRVAFEDFGDDAVGAQRARRSQIRHGDHDEMQRGRPVVVLRRHQAVDISARAESAGRMRDQIDVPGVFPELNLAHRLVDDLRVDGRRLFDENRRDGRRPRHVLILKVAFQISELFGLRPHSGNQNDGFG